MAKELNNPIKAGLGYTIANILIKSVGFLSLPIFTRLLTTEEFGLFSVFMAYESILTCIIGFTMHTSVKKANYVFKNQIGTYVSTIIIIYLINTLILLIFVLVFKAYLVSWLDLSFISIVLLILYSLGTSTISLYNEKISISYNYKRYMLISAISSFGNIGLSLLLISTLFSSNHYLGRIVGATLSVFIITVSLIVFILKKNRPVFNKEYIKFAFVFSLPIIPHGISQVVLAQFDRVMIKKMVGDSKAGIYSFTSNIGIILSVISSSFITVWSSWCFEKLESNGKKEINKNASLLLLFFTFLTIGLLGISVELIKLLGTNAYWEGKNIVVPIILNAYILFIYSIIVQGEYYHKKTMWVLFGTIIAAIINVITNIFFISRYGYVAAAYTTLASYSLYLILHLIISRICSGFNIIPLNQLFFNLFFIAIFCFIILFFLDNMLIRCLFLLIFEAIVFAYCMLNFKDEIKNLKMNLFKTKNKK